MKILLLIFLCYTFHAAFSRSLEECSGDPTSLHILDSREIKGNLFEPIKIRFPETGEYSSAISCLRAIDENNSHSDPVVTLGGLKQYFVEITISPWLLEQLKYRFEIYSS